MALCSWISKALGEPRVGSSSKKRKSTKKFGTPVQLLKMISSFIPALYSIAKIYNKM